MTRDLRPSVLALFGLEEAIRDHAERFQDVIFDQVLGDSPTEQAAAFASVM
jgi:hypothetical protein